MFSVLRSKKGTAYFEVATVVIFIFVLGLAFISFSDSTTDLQGTLNDSDLSNTSKTIALDGFNKLPGIVDFAILFLLAMLWISAIITSLYINTSPVFVPIIAILVSFIVYIGGMLSNSFFDLTSTMSTSSYPYTIFIMNHIVVISVLMGFSIILTMFAKIQ